MTAQKPKALLWWSSGKDSGWTLHLLRQSGDVDVVGLVTTFNEATDRVGMHDVRMELVRAQAISAGLPLWEIPIPWPCSNVIYESRLKSVITRAVGQEITHFAFGDLFLEDIRAYRETQLAGTGIQPLFPLWNLPTNTTSLARQMVQSGLRATLTCVDTRQLDPQFAGRDFDSSLLSELPVNVDPCGERGEFHTFCYAGPMFEHPISFRRGESVDRDGFRFVDLLPGPSECARNH